MRGLHKASLILLMYLFCVSPLIAQETHCDPTLQVDSANIYSYQERGDRCEGIYIQELNAINLQVISLVARYDNTRMELTDSLHLKWNISTLSPVYIRARALGPRIYYRMDSTRPEGNMAYRWPTDLLSRLQINPRDLGITAWMTTIIGNQREVIYIPLTINQSDGPKEDTDYELGILPREDLGRVFLSISKVDSTGKQIEGESTYSFRGPYPSFRSFTVPISGLSKEGLYRVLIAARIQGGGVVTKQIWILHHYEDRQGE